MKEEQEYLDSLPKKRMGSGALLFNEAGELLIVKPNYKDGWAVPGGTVDENESPREACIREIKEEVNLDIENVRMICLDYQKDSKGESLQFLFASDSITVEQISQLRVQEIELDEYKFISVTEAENYLRPKLLKRLPWALEAIKNNSAVYLENGEKS